MFTACGAQLPLAALSSSPITTAVSASFLRPSRAEILDHRIRQNDFLYGTLAWNGQRARAGRLFGGVGVIGVTLVSGRVTGAPSRVNASSPCLDLIGRSVERVYTAASALRDLDGCAPQPHRDLNR